MKNRPATLQLGPQFRDFQIDPGTLDAKARTVALRCSTEAPVARWFGQEILSHAPGAVRLARMTTCAPLLRNHDPNQHIGTILTAELDSAGKCLRCTAKLSRNPAGEAALNDLQDGILRGVSIGYQVHSMRLTEASDTGDDTYTADDWEPTEASLVAMPADLGAHVGRAADPRALSVPVSFPPATRTTTTEGSTMEAPAQPSVASTAPAAPDHTANERKRTTEILALGQRHGLAEQAQAAIADGSTVDAFRTIVLDKLGAKPATAPATIGMNKRELRQYSLVRALATAGSGRPLDGLEKEASDAEAKRIGREARGFFIPSDVGLVSLAEARGLSREQQRALTAGTGSAGGYAVQTDVLTGSLIELLRNKVLVAKLGAVSLAGLVGNVAVPKQSGGATAYWLTETGELTLADQTFGQLGLTPHRLAGATAYSKLLLAQTTLDVEAFVRADLVRVLALALDAAAIAGTGADGQPTGLLNTTGLGTVTFSGAATWAKVLAFETAVATANADQGALAYLTTPAVRGKWKGTPKVSAYPEFLWQGGDLVNGYPAAATNQVPSDKVLFGNWADLILAMWDGMDVVVDPYTLAQLNQVRTFLHQHVDVGVRHPASFCKSTDTGAA